MDVPHIDYGDAVAEIELFLDGERAPFARYRPPASVSLDTTKLTDGPHVLRIQARDVLGKLGTREIPFVVQNGPGITVTGLRANERIGGVVELSVNAFSATEPFDPVRAESSGPIPVWTWVMIALIGAWAGWYGLTEFHEPASFASTASGGAVAAANAPMQTLKNVPFSGRGAAAGFDYAATGPNLYTANCSACHGAGGAGVSGAFPPLSGDPVVTANDPKRQIDVVLHGLHGAKIKGTTYASQMPPFARLSDDDVAAIIDHERTSWGNNAPLVNPDDVKRAR